MDNVQPGQQLGPYRIINQIGQGGMATVYKAYHAAMDRYVAVKVLPRQFAESKEFMGRFQQEARTIANLEHPHILPVHDFGESGGITYFVMRFLDTGTLKERLAAGPMPLAEVDRLFTQLADALGYAHQRGVVHRDIKPSNVLVDARGDVFLTDFGIAKLMEGAAQFTATGAITGTPAYMSPEQAQGEKLDQRSDIYSLGIVLYEMVTGRVPFEAETPLAVILKHMQAPLPLPSSIKPDLSPEIERVLLKALAKDRNDRFATCKEFLAAWKFALSVATPAAPQARSGDTVKAPPPQPTVEAASAAKGTVHTKQIAPEQKRGLPLGWIIGGVVVVAAALLAVLIVGAFVLNRIARPRSTSVATSAGVVEPTPAEGQTAEPPATAAPGITSAPPIVGEGEWTSWVAGNTIFNVAINGDKVYTAGPGGITVWSRDSGEVLSQVTTADGLPSAEVRALLVENENSIWAGTEHGLAYYDGNEVTLYNTDDGLDSDVISAITRLSDGRLVVGTHYSGREGGGLNVFDGSSWQPAPDFPSAHHEENPDVLSNFVNAMLESPDGLFWVGTMNGLGRYDGQTWTRFTTVDGLPSNDIFTLSVDSQGLLIIGTSAGVAYYDRQTFTAADQGPPDGVYGILEGLGGRYWFSGDGGIWRFDPGKGDWKEISEGTGDLPEYSMYGAAIDGDGNLYFGSDGSGLVRFSGGDEKDIAVWSLPNVPSSAALGGVLAAPDGTIWFVEEYGAYVDVFNPQDETWSRPQEDLPGWPMFFDAQGSVWVSEWNNGFWIIGSDNQTHISADQGLPTDYQVRDVEFTADGTTWIATDLGLAVFDGQAVTQILMAADTGLPSDFIRTMLAASDGSLWVSGEHSLARRYPDGTWEQFGSGNPFSYDGIQVYDIAEDTSGVIWVVTDGDGVYGYDGEEWEQFTSGDPNVQLPSPEVNCVTVAPDGSLWFGTRDGIARFNGSEWFSAETSPDGLVNGNVNDIYVDADGEAYFATSGGVSRFRP